MYFEDYAKRKSQLIVKLLCKKIKIPPELRNNMSVKYDNLTSSIIVSYHSNVIDSETLLNMKCYMTIFIILQIVNIKRGKKVMCSTCFNQKGFTGRDFLNSISLNECNPIIKQLNEWITLHKQFMIDNIE